MKHLALHRIVFAIVALATCATSGCSSFNVLEKRMVFETAQNQLPPEIQIERGKPRPLIDRLGKMYGVPNQIALGDRRVDNHSVSEQTEQQVLNYLQDQQLDSVLVRVNQYAPLGEWKRMVANDDIRPIWKLTAGNYNLLKYTFLPGRITGGDWYNPYSKTLNLYSDVGPLAVSKAAYARDLSSRLNPGAYAALKEVPLLGLQHDTTANRLAIDWYSTQNPDQLESAQSILNTSYGASLGSQIGGLVPYGEVIGRMAGGLAGQAVNVIQK